MERSARNANVQADEAGSTSDVEKQKIGATATLNQKTGQANGEWQLSCFR